MPTKAECCPLSARPRDRRPQLPVSGQRGDRNTRTHPGILLAGAGPPRSSATSQGKQPAPRASKLAPGSEKSISRKQTLIITALSPTEFLHWLRNVETRNSFSFPVTRHRARRSRSHTVVSWPAREPQSPPAVGSPARLGDVTIGERRGPL